MILLCSRMHSLNLNFIFLLSTLCLRIHVVCCLCFWCNGAASVIDLIIVLLGVLIGITINKWALRICVHLLNCKILSHKLNSGAASHYTRNLHSEPSNCDCSNLSWCVLIESYKRRSVANMSRVARCEFVAE